MTSELPSSPPITVVRCVKWGKWFSRFSSSPLWLATLLLSLALAALYSRWLKQNLKPSRATHPSLWAVTLLCLHPKWQLPRSSHQSHHPTVTEWDLALVFFSLWTERTVMSAALLLFPLGSVVPSLPSFPVPTRRMAGESGPASHAFNVGVCTSGSI